MPLFGKINSGASGTLDENFMHVRDKNQGNFRSTLKLMASQCNDGIMLDHLKTVKENYSINPKCKETTFVSTPFVHLVLKCTKQYILSEVRDTIINECGSIYSMQIDTSKDIACKNQCSLLLRYVKADLTICNRVVALLPITGTSSGHKLFEFVKAQIEEIGLDIKSMIACCTDGASNMYSENVGLSKYLTEENEKLIYTWCASHRYNLAVEPMISSVDASITNIFDTLHSISKLLRASTARMEKWTETLTRLRSQDHSINEKSKPIKACDTRWWSKYLAIERLMRTSCHYMAYILTLNEVEKLPLKQKTKEEITHAMETLLKFDNVVIAYLVCIVMKRLYQDVIALQASDLMITEVLPTITATNSFLSKYLGKTEDYEKALYDAREFANTLNARLIQQNVQNLELNLNHNETHVYDIFNKLISNLIHNFHKRFLADLENLDTKHFFEELSIMNPKEIQNIRQNSQINLSKICELINLNETVTTKEVKEFGNAFHNYKRSQGIPAANDLGNKATQNDYTFLKEFIIMNKDYKNVFRLYQFIYTLPSSQVDCERCFSTMKLVKTRTRSSMGDATLDNCVVIKLSTDLLPRTVHQTIINLIAESSKKLKTLLLQKN